MPGASAAWMEHRIFLRMQGLLLGAIQERRKPRVFEWGPGFSTLFFAVRECQIITVEHSEMWMKAQRNSIKQSGFTNIDLRYRPPGVRPEGRPEPDPSDPWGYASKDALDLDYGDYVREIHAQPGKYDLIYIDGRARPSCLIAAESHVFPGGHIAMHDSHRQHYERAKDYLDCWELDEISDGPSQISIWRKP